MGAAWANHAGLGLNIPFLGKDARSFVDFLVDCLQVLDFVDKNCLIFLRRSCIFDLLRSGKPLPVQVMRPGPGFFAGGRVVVMMRQDGV